MTKKWISLLLVLVVVFTALIWIGFARFASDVAAAPGQCNLQGAWVSSFYGPWQKPLIMQETISPLDPAGNKLTYTMHLVNPDATFGFPIPPFTEAEYMSDLIGEAVRTGRDTYDFSLIGYGVKNVAFDRGDILYILTVTGTMTCIDDENKTDSVYLAVYLAEQDSDKDGFPDEDEEPFFCVGPSPLSEAKRVPQMPACVPLPPPESE
jgi:hypothetical protein